MQGTKALLIAAYVITVSTLLGPLQTRVLLFVSRMLLTMGLPCVQSEVFSSMGTSIKGSAGRLGRMAQQGNKVAILKLAGMIIGVVVVLWYGMSWAFRWK